MDYTFSDRVNELKPSAIREILKVTQDKSVISLAAGNPSPESFPIGEMAKITADLFANNPSDALQYGMTEGHTKLRMQTKQRLIEKFNTGTEDDDLIITSGGQQAIDLTTKVLVNEGDSIVCEDPSFVGALNTFRSYRAKLIGCPMDELGMDLNKLEQILNENKNIRFIYTIPNFQNPTGKAMPLERRIELLAIAKKYGVIILEDNPYYELRFSGEHIPTIKSMDTDGRVIYTGSYSKILAPGIRIGFVLANKSIVSKMVVAKQTSDVHTNLFFQTVVSEYLEKYDVDSHIKDICDIYSKKCDCMADALAKNLDPRVTFVKPEGGLFLWLQMPDGCNGIDFCARLGAEKVAAVPGIAFSADESEISSGVRLNFSLPSEEQIIKAIEILSKVMQQYLKEVL